MATGVEDLIRAAVVEHQAETAARAEMPVITREMYRAARDALRPFEKEPHLRPGTADCDVNAVTFVFYGGVREIAEAVFEAMWQARKP